MLICRVDNYVQGTEPESSYLGSTAVVEEELLEVPWEVTQEPCPSMGPWYSEASMVAATSWATASSVAASLAVIDTSAIASWVAGT